MSDIILQNLLSPVVLFFALGILAAMMKSDLKFPAALSDALSIYLLIAIGLKGGIELSHYALGSVLKPILGTLFLGVLIPFIAMIILRFMKMDLKNSIGLAATYGSVSIVTYGAAISFLEAYGKSFEGYMNVIVVLMESPAIFISLLLLKLMEKNKELAMVHARQRIGIRAGNSLLLGGLFSNEVMRESLFGKSVLLLTGSLLIGWIAGEGAVPIAKPLFMDLYQSVLILFLLNMGLIAGQRLPEVKQHGWKIILFGLFMPVLCGSLGVLVGNYAGLSVGGTALMGTLAGSASYIAAPAALRTSVPDANPSIYLGLSLGITFPFNLIIGIPLYYALAQMVH
ncbi:sodium-dependent bicarbonate transport family permease [Paenibacillus harenae]|uniref:sodium-dependent bicarbonate transport family permease n=1 Tax=Paenibacillus harenae TaxID=306543 RepID=UPI0004270116|nr:sodium-dependent bicarbonate transport family permease [Paenibacillus harenae]